ncbi:YfdX family protein [Thiorhodococcus mannitoliphagus]|uniref:YfdX family protein n=1 Tax=Thiorhodococcus mannitoliphagus TaxID=329406 RepID=A0A6P1DP92_9GAMM|nr:YfdX family protein [Thiorhodococcus mannitoliphagus]NEX19798.1 YfdX family protein [Thiorhodococcus mannitoliphagus]
MKATKEIAAIAVLALGVAGVGQLYAETQKTEGTPQAQVSQEAVRGSEADRQVELSEHGLAAMNDIHLARVAINDGYVDNARDLLKEAKSLLDTVKSEDRPASAEKAQQVAQDTQGSRDDMIPILSDLQVVESYSLDAAKPKATQSATASADKASSGDAAKAVDSKAAKTQARSDAVAKASEHLSKGERGAAAEALQMVDLALVDQTLSMPLSQTVESVDQALKLIQKDELHQANLELKKARDALVLTTHVVNEPLGSTDSGKAPESAKQSG